MNAAFLQAVQSESGITLPYLRFRLDPRTSALLSTANAREVLDIPMQRLTPIPNMSAHVLGLLNWRSRALWAIDLGQLLGLPPLAAETQQYHMAILRVGDNPFGLAVQEVEGVMRLSADDIQSPMGVISADLTAYLQGCVLQEKELLLVLDAAAIATALTGQSNASTEATPSLLG
jgi:positive phototaxis protein PixI